MRGRWREQAVQPLDTTNSVRQAYIRLDAREDESRRGGRGPFFATAAEGIRRILVGRA